MATKKEVSKDWKATLERLDKDYGKGSVMKLGDKMTGTYDVISTGSIAFDHALGVEGVPLGRLIEIQGWEGTGKTTICGHLTANAQKTYKDRKVVYIDGEHSLDLNYFRALGVDTNELYINQPYNCQEGFNIAGDLIETGQVSLLIIDSDTSLKPLSEVEEDFGKSSIGKKAWLNSQAYPTLKNLAHKYNTALVVISQFREKIGVMFGSPVTTSGGNALKFTSDIIMVVSKTVLKEDDQQYGNETKVKIVKNKVGKPYIECKFIINYGQGIDTVREIVDLGVELKIIDKAGSWYSYEGSKIGQGEDSVKQLLIDNPDVKDEIEAKIREKLKNPEDEEKIEVGTLNVDNILVSNTDGINEL
jgi:recombination protein RecA